MNEWVNNRMNQCRSQPIWHNHIFTTQTYTQNCYFQHQERNTQDNFEGYSQSCFSPILELIKLTSMISVITSPWKNCAGLQTQGRNFLKIYKIRFFLESTKCLKLLYFLESTICPKLRDQGSRNYYNLRKVKIWGQAVSWR